MQNNIATIGDNLPPNSAEALQTTLAEKHYKILEGAANLVNAASRIPQVIEDDETAGKAGDYIKMVTGSMKNLEAERVNEKEPYLSLGRVVDGFFKKRIDELTGAKMTASRPLDTYLKKKAAEEQRKRMEEAAELRRQQEEQEKAAKMLADAQMQPQADKMLDQAVITEQVAKKAEASAVAKPADMAQSRGSSGSLASLRTVWVGELTDTLTLDLEKLRHHINPADLQKAVNSFVRAGGRELAGAKIFEKSETVVR